MLTSEGLAWDVLVAWIVLGAEGWHGSCYVRGRAFRSVSLLADRASLAGRPAEPELAPSNYIPQCPSKAVSRFTMPFKGPASYEGSPKPENGGKRLLDPSLTFPPRSPLFPHKIVSVQRVAVSARGE